MKRFIIAPIALTFVASSALAGPPPNKAERAKDKAAIKEDHREVRNDRWDAARLDSLAARYLAASASPIRGKIVALDTEFLAELNLELRESHIEVAEKNAEVKQSKAEVEKEKRQVGRNILKGQPVRAVKNSVELADDKRDLKDDRGDLGVEIAHRNEKQILHKRFVSLRGKIMPAPIAEKLGIINEALALARSEVVGDVKERREDRRELREDRRKSP